MCGPFVWGACDFAIRTCLRSRIACPSSSVSLEFIINNMLLPSPRKLSPSMVVEPSLWTTNTHSVPATMLTKSPSSAIEHRSIPVPVRKVSSLSLVATTTLPFPCRSASERVRIDLDGVGPPAATPSTRTLSPRSYVHSPCVAQLP
jgi:hypothetical protein